MEITPIPESVLQFAGTPVGFLYYYLITTLLGFALGYKFKQQVNEIERKHEAECVLCEREGHEKYHRPGEPEARGLFEKIIKRTSQRHTPSD